MIGWLTRGMPRPWRTVVDWLVTIAGAILIVLARQAVGRQPVSHPVASMEPTLDCARPADGCEGRFSDRVLACRICYRFGSPARGDVIVFNTPPVERATAAPAAST